MFYTIEPATYEHLAHLPAIERAAAELFPDHLVTPEIRARTVPLEQLEAAQAGQRLWVALTARGEPVGFAIVVPIGETAFLQEIDVHPAHQRRGLGRRLIDAVVRWGKAQGFASITLTTFAHLPWNAPFYERLGFRRLTGSELSEDLRHRLENERQQGLRERVAMQLPL